MQAQVVVQQRLRRLPLLSCLVPCSRSRCCLAVCLPLQLLCGGTQGLQLLLQLASPALGLQLAQSGSSFKLQAEEGNAGGLAAVFSLRFPLSNPKSSIPNRTDAYLRQASGVLLRELLRCRHQQLLHLSLPAAIQAATPRWCSGSDGFDGATLRARSCRRAACCTCFSPRHGAGR